MMESNMLSWVKRHVLGRGSYGTVFLASPVLNNSNSKTIAVKSADMQLSSSLKQEGHILYELRGCPEIIRCYGDDISFEKGKQVFNLLLEYAPGGTLADLINKRCGRAVPEWEVCWYTYLLLLGLSHIHEEGYVHCDLKPDNVLVFPTHDLTLNHLKIADLGLAKKAGTNTKRPIFMNGCCFFHRGAPLYSSPESAMYGQHESPMDIWSLGCIVMKMLTGKSAYPEGYNAVETLVVISWDQSLPKKLTDHQDNISLFAKDFLRRCFERNPRERWTADQLLQHPFIVDYLKILRGLGVVRNPETESSKNPIAPTSWWSGISLFLDPTTTPPAGYSTSSPAANYRAALLKGLRKVTVLESYSTPNYQRLNNNYPAIWLTDAGASRPHSPKVKTNSKVDQELKKEGRRGVQKLFWEAKGGKKGQKAFKEGMGQAKKKVKPIEVKGLKYKPRKQGNDLNGGQGRHGPKENQGKGFKKKDGHFSKEKRGFLEFVAKERMEWRVKKEQTITQGFKKEEKSSSG